jgi:hypothetical protein
MTISSAGVNVNNDLGVSGNVGIGTAPSATYKVNVNGTLNDTNVLLNGNTISGSKWTTATDTTEIYYNSGNVGIGTTDPLALLDLVKATGAGVATDLINMRFNADWGLKLQQNYTGAGNIQYDFIHRYSSVNYNALTFKGANVGIGTTSPAYKCHIKSTYDNAATGLHLDAGDTGTDPNRYALTIYPYVQGGGQVGWRFRTQSYDGGNTTPLQFYHNGNVLMNGNLNVGSLNSGYGVFNSYLLSYDAVYARSSFDTKIRSDSGGMYLEMGDIGNNNYLRIGAYGGATNIDSKSARSIYFRCDAIYWIFSTGGASYNAANSIYWTNPCDQLIKENIKKANLNTCYENVKNINLYRFNYIDGYKKSSQHDKTQLGFVAQQVKQHFPKSITRDKVRFEDKREIPDLSVINADQVNYTLFGAVKQLMKVVEKQSKRIKKLEELLNIIDDDEVENDADEPYERIVCDEVDIDTIEPSEPQGV